MNKMILAIVLLGGVCFAASFSTPQSSMAMEDATLFIKDTCTVCHGLARVCTNLEKDETWWATTLERMAFRGASLTQSDVPTLAGYLAEPDAELLKVCGK